MVTYILLVLIVYFLYQFIFRFVVPIARASRKMQEKVQEMQSAQGYNSDEGETNRRKPGYTTSNNGSSAKTSTKDYIDFEEIK